MKILSQTLILLVLASLFIPTTFAQSPGLTLPIWPDLAPGESSREPGTALPLRATDQPIITRVENITQPTMDVFLAEKPNGTGIVILPGGGFKYVVPDLEGSEATTALNRIGISVFVLRYRTTPDATDKPWARPLQDSQRAIRTVRSQAKKWNLDPQKIGLLGFSAGGQVAAIHLTQTEPAYSSIDEIDKSSFRPDFAMLIYPWRIYDGATDDLISPIKVGKETPPTFLVHTHDDQSTSLGAVMFYAHLKKQNISSELHVYQNGGHGYGVRSRPKSAIGTWQDRAIEWLELRELGRASE